MNTLSAVDNRFWDKSFCLILEENYHGSDLVWALKVLIGAAVRFLVLTKKSLIAFVSLPIEQVGGNGQKI